MNINIIFSFVIGGLLLLALLVINTRVLRNSGETTLSMTTKQKVEVVNKIIRFDLTRLGFNVDGSSCEDSDDSPAILTATPTTFSFCADIDNDPATGASAITWSFTNNEYTGTPNPNDFVLIRVGPVSTTAVDTSRFGVLPLQTFPYFQYYDTNGNTASGPAEILGIRVSFRVQSAVKYDENYLEAFFQASFYPPNLVID